MQLNKIPTTVVTGFLGSGKTTLLSNILKQATGKRIAVIVNEFGELDIDAELLRNCPLDCESDTAATDNSQNGIYELANGCICCTVEEEFLPVMQQLVERRNDIDHILIETSGLALPKPLVQAFNWPGIKEYCTVDAVITMVDGPAVAAGRFAHDTQKVQSQRLEDPSLDHDPSLKELLEDQLSSADLVLVSKVDLLTERDKQKVNAVIEGKVPSSVKTTYISLDGTQLNTIIGLNSAAELKTEDDHNHHDRQHALGEHHDHAHEHFDSFVITLPTVNSDCLQQAINALLIKFNIFRIKGFVALPGKPMRQVLQAVGQRLDVYFDRPWQTGETRKTQLVFIGKNISAELVKNELTSSLVSTQ